MAESMQDGWDKYGPFNWRVAGVQALVYLGALRRHLYALLDGEDYDPKTGKHHGGYIMACMAIYLDALVSGRLIDNRPIPGKTGALIQMLNRRPDQETPTAQHRMEQLERFIELNAPSTALTLAELPKNLIPKHQAQVQNGRRKRRHLTAEQRARIGKALRKAWRKKKQK